MDEFIGLLKRYGVAAVVDVRRWNSSRKFPEFSGKGLEKALGRVGIEYYWFPRLGGYRRFGLDVEDRGIASCFESEGFRAYATYITTREDVVQDIEAVEAIAENKTAALICSERLPWRCHRKILSDYFVARGFKVLHIIGEEEVVEHSLSKCAEVVDSKLRYR